MFFVILEYSFKGIDVTAKFEDRRCLLTSGLANEVIGIFFEDAIVSIGIGLRQIASSDVPAQAEVIAFMVMCLDGDY